MRAPGDVAEENVLGHLGVWPGGGTGGVAGEFAVEVDGEIVLTVGLGNVPAAARQREQSVLGFRLQVEPIHKISKWCGDEFGHAGAVCGT